MVKHLLTVLETWLWSLGQEDPLEKEMATHSSTLAWKIPWTEECSMLQSMGLKRVGHDWETSLLFTLYTRDAELYWNSIRKSDEHDRCLWYRCTNRYQLDVIQKWHSTWWLKIDAEKLVSTWKKIKVEFYTPVKMKEYITSINRDGSCKHDTEWKKSKFRKKYIWYEHVLYKTNNKLYCLRNFSLKKNQKNHEPHIQNSNSPKNYLFVHCSPWCIIDSDQAEWILLPATLGALV